MAALITLALFPPVASAADSSISISGTLTPRDLAIGVGDTVTWINNDGVRHRMQTTSGPIEFDSGNLDPGETFSFTFDLAGTYLYMDDRDRDNSDYYGTIIVTDGVVVDPGAPLPPPPSTGDVRIINDTFQPGTIAVNVGGTVTWLNQDREHTVTARDGAWDSGIFDAGQSFAQTFTAPGTVEYFCIIHPDMVGTVVVGEGGEPLPPPPPPSPTPPPSPPPPAPGASDISMIDNDFAPANLTVTVGSVVRWVNSGTLPHTATAAGQFDSGILMAGDTWSRTFTAPGTFNYVCTLHPEMIGTIVVTGTGSDAPPTGGDGDAPPTGGDDTGNPDPPLGERVGPPRQGVEGSVGVNMIDNAYDPFDIEVRAGSSITWTNIGELPHTITARDESFDSGFLMTGESWTRQFDQVEVYEYFCTIHPEMVGRVTVVAAAEPAEDGSAASGASGTGIVGPQPAAPASSGGFDGGPGTVRDVAALAGNVATLFLALLAAASVAFFVRATVRRPLSDPNAE
jgi:plastocyanin